jgi:hypothetical protein
VQAGAIMIAIIKNSNLVLRNAIEGQVIREDVTFELFVATWQKAPKRNLKAKEFLPPS